MDAMQPVSVGTRPGRGLMAVALAGLTMMAVLAASSYGTAEAAATWTQVGADIDGEAADDQSGWSLGMSSDGNTVIIGAQGNDGTGSNAGHVRIYDWDGGAWVQRGSDIDGEAAGDFSGRSVAMSSDGNTVIIGAPFNTDTDSFAGHVRIYHWDGGTWVQRGSDIDGDAAGDQSGWSVGMSSDGNTVIIGAPFNDGTASDAGHARIYTTALSPEALISTLGHAVQDLLDSGELAAGQADALQGKLDAATDKLDQGQPDNAIKKLEDFIAKVERWVNRGKVDAAVGAELIASAQAVIAAINAS